MIDVGVHVSEKAVLVRGREVPGGRRSIAGQRNADDRLNTLETVLPRHGQTHRRTVLRRQRFTVDPGREHGQRVHGLVETQALYVGIRQPAANKAVFLARHLLWGVERLKRHIFCVAGGLHQFEKLVQRKADPRHHHRPGFDAAHPVDTLLQRKASGQIVMIESDRFSHLTVDLQRPGIGFHAARVSGGIGFVEAKLIEVVVARNLILGGEGQGALPLGRLAELKRLTRRGFRAIVAFKPVEQVGMGS